MRKAVRHCSGTATSSEPENGGASGDPGSATHHEQRSQGAPTAETLTCAAHAAWCPGHGARISVDADAGAFDHFRPFVPFRPDELSELDGPHRERLSPDLLQGTGYFGQRKDAAHFIGELLDDRRRRAGGGEQTLPARRLESWQR